MLVPRGKGICFSRDLSGGEPGVRPTSGESQATHLAQPSLAPHPHPLFPGMVLLQFTAGGQARRSGAGLGPGPRLEMLLSPATPFLLNN